MNNKTRKLTILGLLTAIVVIMQLFVHIQFGIFSLSTVLVPIVVGAALYGAWAGAWLGLVFAATVLLSGEAAFFLGLNIPGTIILVIAKGVACGAVSGWMYGLIYKKNAKLAVVVASGAAPVVNTGVFILGCLIFFDYNMAYILTAFVGINFFIELAFNLVLSSTVLLIIKQGRKSINEGSHG